VIGTGTYLNEGNPNLLKRARDFAEGKRFSLGVELNEENCVLKKMCSSAFGREMQQEFPEFREFVGAIEPARLQMFSSAKKVEDLVEANRLDEAWTVYAQETMSAVNELQAQLNRIKELESEYLEGFMEAGNIYANETTPALKQVQALLAQIRQDARDGIMTDEAMLGAATQTKAVTAVLALVAIVVGVGAAFLIVRGVSKVLKSISNEMDTGANQVASAASQVSSGAQSLAEGTSEQAASLEETSASLEELSSMSSRNDESSQEAQRVVQEAGTLMSGASKAMGSLNSSMSEIAEASEETRKIIKTIDEIAFQTNILALNAAVEAARAGEAGAGFAVVADEVRNLAQRAAQAAGDTADLIAKSVDRIGAGQQYVTETDEAFKKVQDSTEQVSQLISQIASASKEQLDGISQINSAVTDMDKVTQTSAAGAEESASAAEELSAQAEVMKGQVAQLIALVDKKRAAEATHGGDFRGSSGYRQPSPSYHHAKPGRNGSNHENGQSPNNRLNKQSEEPAVSSMGGDWE
jgi:methyl-accepting chemotaxis protein